MESGPSCGRDLVEGFQEGARWRRGMVPETLALTKTDAENRDLEDKCFRRWTTTSLSVRQRRILPLYQSARKQDNLLWRTLFAIDGIAAQLKTITEAE